jgi:serine/threonine protein phosphatase 1
LLERIGADAGGIGNADLIFVGDYVDRGEESRAVLERLAALCTDHPSQVTCLLGNHEQMLLDFLDDPEANAGRWLRNGGLQTLASFSVGGVTENPAPETARQAAHDLRAQLGPDLEAWLRSRPVQHRDGNVHFVHAAADPALPMSVQDRKHLIWGHPAFATVPRSDGQWVVHGHTIVDAPAAADGRISIDTGAWYSGRLTSVRLSPEGLSFLEC